MTYCRVYVVPHGSSINVNDQHLSRGVNIVLDISWAFDMNKNSGLSRYCRKRTGGCGQRDTRANAQA